MIAFFKKSYDVMRFTEQEIINGYQTSDYEKICSVMLDVQEDSSSMSKDAEGKRSSRSLTAFGQFDFRIAAYPDVKGDRIRYKGQWYECTSCVFRNNTILTHYMATFTLVPDGGTGNEF